MTTNNDRISFDRSKLSRPLSGFSLVQTLANGANTETGKIIEVLLAECPAPATQVILQRHPTTSILWLYHAEIQGLSNEIFSTQLLMSGSGEMVGSMGLFTGTGASELFDSLQLSFINRRIVHLLNEIARDKHLISYMKFIGPLNLDQLITAYLCHEWEYKKSDPSTLIPNLKSPKQCMRMLLHWWERKTISLNDLEDHYRNSTSNTSELAILKSSTVKINNESSIRMHWTITRIPMRAQTHQLFTCIGLLLASNTKADIKVNYLWNIKPNANQFMLLSAIAEECIGNSSLTFVDSRQSKITGLEIDIIFHQESK